MRTKKGPWFWCALGLCIASLGWFGNPDAWARATINHQEVAAAEATLSPKQLQQDFALFREALEEGHPGLYRYSSMAQMNASFDTAAKQLEGAMSVVQFYQVLAPVVGQIKCGHTELILPPIEAAKVNQSLLPLQITILDGRLFVIRDYTPSNSLVGSEILQLNHIPARELLDRISAVVHGDGNTATSSASALSDGLTFSEKLLPVLGIHGPFEMIIQQSNGQKQSVRLNVMPRIQIEAVARVRYSEDLLAKANAEFQLTEEDTIGVMTVRSFREFASVDKSHTMVRFFADSFHLLGQRKTQVLILDVRNNGGGDDQLGKELAGYLLDTPFSYYRELVINSLSSTIFPRDERIEKSRFEKQADGTYHKLDHPNLGLQQPAESVFSGKLIVLANGGSFSTTCELLSILKAHRRATFVGEETGGTYGGNTSGFGAAVILPNSKIKLDIPRLAYYMDVSGEALDRGILPDVSVTLSLSDVMQHRDKGMDAALTLARQMRRKQSSFDMQGSSELRHLK